MDLAIKEDYLSQAIGRNGQNVKLASELTQWYINVMSEAAFSEKSEQESKNVLELFINSLEVDPELAAVLVDAGFSTLEEIVYVPEEELLNVEGFDESIAQEIRERASNILLTRALTDDPDHFKMSQPTESLLNLEGMPHHIAFALAKKGIF